jgi:hypothetical protein
MFAVEKVDEDSVRLLAKAGARLGIKNDDGDTAEDIAINTGKKWLRNSLYPEKEQGFFKRLTAGAVKVGRHIVSWVDNKFNGAMKRAFGFRGERQDSTEKALRKMKPGPEEPTPEEFVKNVDTYVKDTPALEFFFKDDKKFMQNMAKKLVDLANDPTSDLAAPEVLPKTIKVTMHQQVIYCGKTLLTYSNSSPFYSRSRNADDSSSMTNAKGRLEERWENQKRLASRIAVTTTEILPDDEGVALRFINQSTGDESASLKLGEIGAALDAASANGDTPIGTRLRERILTPLVYEPLAAKNLRRPLLVSILTDGGPSKEEKGTLAKVIIECGDALEKNGYPRDSKSFFIPCLDNYKFRSCHDY